MTHLCTHFDGKTFKKVAIQYKLHPIYIHICNLFQHCHFILGIAIQYLAIV